MTFFTPARFANRPMTRLPRREFFILGLILISCSLLAGCKDDSENTSRSETDALPFAGTSVTVFVPKSADDSERWTVLLAEWTARSGATCEVRPYDDAAGFDACRNVWKADESDGSIVMFPRAWMAEMCVEKILAPIPEDLLSVEELNWGDLHSNLASAAYEWEKEPIVLPIREPLLVLYYRSDLLERAELQPPESWEQYHELISTLDQWAPEMTAVEPWGESFRTNLFLARSIPYVKTRGNYSVFLDYGSSEPLIATPGFVKGMRDSLAVQQDLDPRSRKFSPDDCLAAMIDGTAAIGIASAFPAVDRDLPASTKSDARWSTLPLPGATQVFDPGRQAWQAPSESSINRVTLTGWEGTLAGVRSGGTDRSARACWNLLRTLLVETGSDAFAPRRMTATRLSTSRQSVLPPLPGLDARQFTEAVTGSFREASVVPVLVMSKRELFLDALDASVNRVLTGTSEPQAALEELAQTWKELLEEHGQQKLIDSYKGGLGVRIRN